MQRKGRRGNSEVCGVLTAILGCVYVCVGGVVSSQVQAVYEGGWFWFSE